MLSGIQENSSVTLGLTTRIQELEERESETKTTLMQLAYEVEQLHEHTRNIVQGNDKPCNSGDSPNAASSLNDDIVLSKVAKK